MISRIVSSGSSQLPSPQSVTVGKRGFYPRQIIKRLNERQGVVVMCQIAGGARKSSTIPLLVDTSGGKHTSTKGKADCLASYFANKCSLS